MGIVAGTPVPF